MPYQCVEFLSELIYFVPKRWQQGRESNYFVLYVTMVLLPRILITSDRQQARSSSRAKYSGSNNIYNNLMPDSYEY